MKLHYDEDLIEGAVLFCASGRRQDISPLLIQRFHRAREKLYAIPDPDDRNAAFFQLHLDWFREWSLEQKLLALLAEFPLIRQNVRLLAFRKARGKKDEGSELYVNELGRHALAAFQPERFGQEASLAAYLRHEFMHLSDMLDEKFGYVPKTELRIPSPSQQRLALERYAILWDVSIDGRLTKRGRETVAPRVDRVREFDRIFQFWPEEKRAAVFDKMWSDLGPRHRDLMELACDPCGLRDADLPTAGALCPLCGFSTFAWAETKSLSAAALRLIQSEFPSWTETHGLCRRCGEAYDVLIRSA